MSIPISFFADPTFAQTKCKLLAKRHKRSIAWENGTVSPFSPGPIKNKENIARQIFSPIHVDEDGEIKTYAYDDMYSRGLSVNRMEYINSVSLHGRGEEKAERDRVKKPDRKYLGYVIANAGTIRTSTDLNIAWFTIYDTASSKNVTHADVCCIFQPKQIKAYQSRQRRLIQQAFSKLHRP